MKIADALVEDQRALEEIGGLREQLGALQKRLAGDSKAGGLLTAIADLDHKIAAIQADSHRSGVGTDLTRVNDGLASLEALVDTADAAPTEQTSLLFQDYRRELDGGLRAWEGLKSRDLATLNAALRQRGLPPILTSAK